MYFIINLHTNLGNFFMYDTTRSFYVGWESEHT